MLEITYHSCEQQGGVFLLGLYRQTWSHFCCCFEVDEDESWLICRCPEVNFNFRQDINSAFI